MLCCSPSTHAHKSACYCFCGFLLFKAADFFFLHNQVLVKDKALQLKIKLINISKGQFLSKSTLQVTNFVDSDMTFSTS